MKLIRLVLVASFLGSLFACTKAPEPSTAQPTSKTLNIYCWANYFSPSVIEQFEKKSGAKVSFDYFSSNEELLAKLQAGARGYDLIVPTAYMLKALKELKLLTPIGKPTWPELSKIQERFRSSKVDPEFEFSIPYSWGTTGIAVNRAKIKDKVDSWAWVFDRPALKGQITMLDDAPAVIGTALKYLGYGYNEGSAEALAKAKALLIKQRKLLRAYTPEAQPVLESGEVAVAQAYSGDALQVKSRKNPNIEYVLPKEGGELFLDSLAIPVGAKSVDLAKEFMRFTLDQAVALNQVKHLFFSPVLDLSALLQGVPDLSHPAVNPSAEQLKGFEMMEENPTRIEAIQKIWTEIKSE